MKVKILAFGIAKDILGSRQMTLEIADHSNVGELKEHLISRFQEFASLRSLALAVNREYVDDELVLSADDEVVIIPPVSGG